MCGRTTRNNLTGSRYQRIPIRLAVKSIGSAPTAVADPSSSASSATVHPAVSIRAPEERQYLLELFAEVLVEPGVQKRIVARRRHGQTVEHEEHDEIQAALDLVVIVNHIDGAHRQPRDAKHADHCDQHAIRAFLSFPVGFLFFRTFRSRFRSGPVVQFVRHENVARGYNEKGQHELQRDGECAEDFAIVFGRPVFLAVAVVRFVVEGQLNEIAVGNGEQSREEPAAGNHTDAC